MDHRSYHSTFWLKLALVLVLAMGNPISSGLLCSQEEQTKALNSDTKKTEAKKDPSKKKKSKEVDERLKPIPKDKLPKATRTKPDPKKEQFKKVPVFVSCDEIIIPRNGELYAPNLPVIQPYLASYFARAGYKVVDTLQEAKYIIVGNFEGAFVKELKFEGVLVAVNFGGEVSFEVLDQKQKIIDSFTMKGIDAEATIPKLNKKKTKKKTSQKEPKLPEEHYAVIDLRRKIAKEVWKRLYHKKGLFSDGKVSKLIESVTVDSLEAENPLSGDQVLEELVKARFQAVPYLLEALTDTRVVLAPFKYPGLTPLNSEQLRVYHFADKVLEEIFQKVSRMGLDTPDKHRFIIIQGWQNEWKRFCPAWKKITQKKDAVTFK